MPVFCCDLAAQQRSATLRQACLRALMARFEANKACFEGLGRIQKIIRKAKKVATAIKKSGLKARFN